MCLNYVQGGSCLIDGNPCLLGSRGNEAQNKDHECPRHGLFDVWRTLEGPILVSDLQGPHEGVTECYGLGISQEDAMKVAQTRARSLQAKIVTTERKCKKCGARFWAHGAFAGNIAFSRSGAYFCAFCLNQISEAEIHEYLKEISTSGDELGIDLNGWCG